MQVFSGFEGLTGKNTKIALGGTLSKVTVCSTAFAFKINKSVNSVGLLEFINSGPYNTGFNCKFKKSLKLQFKENSKI